MASGWPAFRLGQDIWDYWLDAWQRGVLYLDVQQQRSAGYEKHAAKVAPHVLKFDCELVMDGRNLERPVNYILARITPPRDVEINSKKRPFVVVDPRAGHGPGIGGFKADSEIGVALKAGHPCYFIGFLPEPVPGQTIEDIARAEAAFLERVISLHPHAEGKPAVIGNCQAGWAVMIVAARKPELFGPIIIAGSPLSYWAGVRGTNPMRYTGGLLGGSWLTALTGDLGNGKFDGAWLVSNFENLNPSNTLWSKQYNLYSKIDSEGARYLEFEQWWGGHVLLNAAEMQFIADELFIGNKLVSGELISSDGARIDLRNITSPILVFCSKADNITPPQQALDWILDLYDTVDDIRAHGQTIVYAVHESIGHLGIFVSGSVAKKEHDEFASNIDLIDVLPPGLYEAVLTPKDPKGLAADLITGDYLVRFEARTLDDIRALGGNDANDEREFAAVARVSEINLSLYRTFVQPWMRIWTNEGLAEWMRRIHPLRLQYETYALLPTLTSAAAYVRETRKPVSPENPLWQAQQRFSHWIASSLDTYRDARDQTCEAVFHTVYGSPVVQALTGLNAADHEPRSRPGETAAHSFLVKRRIEAIKRKLTEGGAREAALRSLIYIRMPDGDIDERSFNFLRQMRKDAGKGLSLGEFKTLVREQYLLLLLDERRAVAAIPTLLSREPELAGRLKSTLHRMIDVVGLESDVAKSRLAEIDALFEGGVRARSAPKPPAREHALLATVRPMRRGHVSRTPKHH
ncbi:DUF3141 domain-containing protein [Hyphomicrobium sp.]|uniref:DUF3141 domain-containing protein n=1 Tax=Hyphomicrobium sp. TaxID=82 RepID=UPI002E34981A|nr:DUF3141 domain-containing protein [Hyphomicrobium sp.]HEX2840852.1 DUF3141 domain-containing protein [Hyphomicrobium sp.]